MDALLNYPGDNKNVKPKTNTTHRYLGHIKANFFIADYLVAYRVEISRIVS